MLIIKELVLPVQRKPNQPRGYFWTTIVAVVSYDAGFFFCELVQIYPGGRNLQNTKKIHYPFKPIKTATVEEKSVKVRYII